MKQPTLKLHEAMDRPGSYNLLWLETDMLFDQWSLGIGWAGKADGRIVLLARLIQYPNIENVYHCLLEDRSTTNIDLLDKAVSHISRYLIKNVFGRMDQSMNDFLSRYNMQAKDKRRKMIHVQIPPHADSSGDLSYYISVLQDRLRRSSPTLFIPREFNLVGELVNVSTKTGNVRDYDHPGPAAISYSLAGLEAYSGHSTRSIRKGIDKERANAYDPIRRR